ncbi:MAG: 4'-phosphopantetheinyl transferase superfamily protein [Acidobacteriia bacterium]|nr:4'-phosphopantetheinyl transferase superfamily protein [Terriglobia bacterium]
MNVYWLEQTGADVPPENDWLSANEAGRLNSMRFAKRRADWQLGRWTAKRALSVCLDVPAHPYVLKKIEICAAPSGAPEVFLDSEPAAITISLSHRCRIAACAVAMSHANLGCDLETIEPRSDAFVADYFTTEEQALVARASAADRDRLLALLWSGKESALKALRSGLRLDTRSVIVIPGATSLDRNGWNELRVRYTDGRNTGNHDPGGQVFHGWWQHADNLVRTVVSTPPPDSPIRLSIQAHFFDSASRYAW